jgi:adenylate kinase
LENWLSSLWTGANWFPMMSQLRWSKTGSNGKMLQRVRLLDGFPRTPPQAEALKNMLAEMDASVDVVPYISVPAEVLVERLSGRWTCRAAGHVYHEKYNPPKESGVCDIDGSELYQRDDDKAETVQNRIRVYMEQTSPLIEYYRQVSLLVEIDGTQEIEQVSEDLLAAIKKAI